LKFGKIFGSFGWFIERTVLDRATSTPLLPQPPVRDTRDRFVWKKAPASAQWQDIFYTGTQRITVDSLLLDTAELLGTFART
jgi:hypothetical protein